MRAEVDQISIPVNNRRLRAHPVVPPCFEDWEHWDSYYRPCKRSGLGDPYAKFCFDCTPNNQRDMIEHGRCMWPEVKFFLMDEGTEDEQVIGLRPDQRHTFAAFSRINNDHPLPASDNP